MQQKRREFVKKSAMVVGASVVVGGVAVANGKSESSSNGVVVGQSPKKEITYKKSKAWENYYKQAKQ